MPGVREDWFPTSVWYFPVEGHAVLNERLLPLIRDEQRRDARGITDRSAVLGWHSADDLHRRPPFHEFIAHVTANVHEVVQFFRWDVSRLSPVVINCWANVNGKNASNAVHNHAHSLLSGVYYVQAAPGCGALVFRDPRDAAVMMAPPVREYTPWTFQSVRYEPVAGRMLLFPSWLYHGVEPNRSDAERIALSFNIGLAPRETP
jgi:uncharacterized protein (TIGR02466 family)